MTPEEQKKSAEELVTSLKSADLEIQKSQAERIYNHVVISLAAQGHQLNEAMRQKIKHRLGIE